MKRLLLDTHALLWWLADDAALGEKARGHKLLIEVPYILASCRAW